MEVIIEILTVIDCILLILVVLVQESKGGGLSSSFGGSNQIMGVRQTTDFLEKATWTLAIALLAFSLLSAYFMSSSTTVAAGMQSVTAQQANQMAIPASNMTPMQSGQPSAAAPAQPSQGNVTAPPANPPGKKK